MAIKDLLVGYDGNPASRKALELAVLMAGKYGAAVTGVHVFRTDTYQSHVRHWIPEDVIERVRQAQREAEAGIETSFRDAIAAAGFGGEVQWITAEGYPNVMLARIARYFDLLLLGQFTRRAGNDVRAVSPDDLALRAGGPMVVVPENYEPRPFGGHAMVAWDGSRSAARALGDAMQILETKQRIDVVTVDKASDLGAVPDGVDIVARMKRHGIAADRVVVDNAGASVGEALVDHCVATKPDVLVMGAYGRGRIGSLLFGSVTRHVLKHMPAPVLISH